MKVIDTLPCIRPGIGDHAVSTAEGLPAGQPPHDLEELQEDILMRRIQIGDRCDVLARDDQHMGRRLGVDIPERHHSIGTVDEV